MRKYINRLSPQRQYDLLCALRGPDGEGQDDLKRVVTARVRAIVFEYVPARYEPYKLTPADVDRVREAMRTLNGPSRHCTAHLALAVRASRSHGIWGGLASELIKALGTL